jgi:hypothetical protein
LCQRDNLRGSIPAIATMNDHRFTFTKHHA